MEKSSVSEAVDLINFYLSPQNLANDKLTKLLVTANENGIDLYYLNRNYPKLRHLNIPLSSLIQPLKDNQNYILTEIGTKVYVKPTNSLEIKAVFLFNAPPRVSPKYLQQILPYQVYSTSNIMYAIHQEDMTIVPFRSVEQQQNAFNFYDINKINNSNFTKFKDEINSFIELSETQEFTPNSVIMNQQKVIKIIDITEEMRPEIEEKCKAYGTVKFMRFSSAGKFLQVFYSGVYKSIFNLEGKIEVGGREFRVEIMK